MQVQSKELVPWITGHFDKHYLIINFDEKPRHDTACLAVVRHKQIAWTRLVRQYSKKLCPDVKRLMAEVKLRSSLDHPIIPHFLCVYENEQTLNIVQERAQVSGLLSIFDKHRGLPETRVALIVKQILHALIYSHQIFYP